MLGVSDVVIESLDVSSVAQHLMSHCSDSTYTQRQSVID